MSIPAAPLLLAFAGLLPFLWGVLTLYLPGLQEWTVQTIGPRFAGPYVSLFYGAVILSFMSGVLWGFATRLDARRAPLGYALSVLPALWVFFTASGGVQSAGLSLVAGFAGILALDWYFWRQGAAPEWWMRLRLMISAVVILSLLITVLRG
ncbi:MAG: DUF3429 domain-containing protein [Roseovarius sp.]